MKDVKDHHFCATCVHAYSIRRNKCLKNQYDRKNNYSLKPATTKDLYKNITIGKLGILTCLQQQAAANR